MSVESSKAFHLERYIPGPCVVPALGLLWEDDDDDDEEVVPSNRTKRRRVVDDDEDDE